LATTGLTATAFNGTRDDPTNLAFPANPGDTLNPTNLAYPANPGDTLNPTKPTNPNLRILLNVVASLTTNWTQLTLYPYQTCPQLGLKGIQPPY
jgi:hypothetical protein